MASLVGRTLHVLIQSCLGWWDQLYIVLLCEEFLPGLVDVLARVGALREQHDEPLDGMQCVCKVWQNVPDCPGSRLIMSSTAGCSVTPGQSVKRGEGLVLWSYRGFSRDVTRSRVCLVTRLSGILGVKLPQLRVPFVQYNVLFILLINLLVARCVCGCYEMA